MFLPNLIYIIQHNIPNTIKNFLCGVKLKRQLKVDRELL